MAKNKQGFRLLGKLIENGYTTSKAILSMTVSEMLRLPGMNMTEMGHLDALQKSIKADKLIEYLAESSGDHDERNKTNAPISGQPQP